MSGINYTELMLGIRQWMPLLQAVVDLRGLKTGAVVIDIINGFCKPGCGNYAPHYDDPAFRKMIQFANSSTRRILESGGKAFVARDWHNSERPEFPFLRHCEEGTEEAELVEELKWLENHPDATMFFKECNDFLVASIHRGSSKNEFLEWMNDEHIEAVVFQGVCTDICLMQPVLSVNSARNSRLLPFLKEVVVLAPACATYDLPPETASMMGLNEFASHPAEPFHHMALILMGKNGAKIATDLIL